MKIAKRDLALIMVIVGIMAAFCSYKFYFTGKQEATEAEKTKQEEIQAKIDEVKKEAGKEPQMKSDIQKWEKEIGAMLEKFKLAAIYEDGILYFDKLEKDLELPVRSFTVGETKEVSRVSGQGSFNGKSYVKGTTTYNFSYRVQNYEALKKFINYLVSGNDGVKTIESITFSIGAEEISGNVSMTIHVMGDGTVAYEMPKIDGVEIGKLENIFQQAPVAPEE